jgi:WD40 repeat protein
LPIEASDLAFGPAGNLFVTDGMLKRVPPPHRTAPQPGPALPPSGSPTSDEAGQWKELEVADRAGVVVAERHGEQLASWPLDYSAAPEVIWRRPDGEWLIHWRVTRDGRRLIANLERQDSRSHRLTCVDLETGRERYSLPCNLIYAMAISPDERWFAFSRNDDVEVIDLETGELLRRLPGHTTSIREIGFSPDGRFLASVSDDRTVRCWRFPEGELAWSAMAHDNRATALAFHPDGETLATAGADSIVRFWRHQSGHAVGRIPVSGGFIKDIEFDPGGETLAVVHARADVVLLHARRNNQ